MQFPESWLRNLVNPALDTAQLAHIVTMAGLEVEAMTPAAPPFNNVVVAEILSAEKHPDADRLQICQVDVGESVPVTIVCGAPNAAAGLKVPCARPGAKLPGFEIKVAKVRGVESFGMLCSTKELGLEGAADGLMVLPADAPVGEDFRNWLNLDDTLITLKLTPNRADCLSMQGLAREVGAITGAEVRPPQVQEVAIQIQDTVPVQVAASEACPLYLGRVVRGIDAQAPTPRWMAERLERSGIRPLLAPVDITNYVLLELGQPMHAFALSRLNGGIEVRMARAGETPGIAERPDRRTRARHAGDCRCQRPGGAGRHHGRAADQRGAVYRRCLPGSGLLCARGDCRAGASPGPVHRLVAPFRARCRFWRHPPGDGTRHRIAAADICGGQAGPINETVASLPSRSPITLRLPRLKRVVGSNSMRIRSRVA